MLLSRLDETLVLMKLVMLLLKWRFSLIFVSRGGNFVLLFSLVFLVDWWYWFSRTGSRKDDVGDYDGR